jgi:hypothetical protein
MMFVKPERNSIVAGARQAMIHGKRISRARRTASYTKRSMTDHEIYLNVRRLDGGRRSPVAAHMRA